MTVALIASVGDAGGQNRPEDVRTVYALFNEIVSTPLAVSDACSPGLIQAIRDFQLTFMAHPDGRIDVGGRTWRELTAAVNASEDELSASVGDSGGQNRARDVRIVYELFNTILSSPLAVSDACSDELIGVIRAFQAGFMSRPDGRIDVGGRTWGRLVEAAANPGSGNGNGQAGVPADAEINLGGPDAAWTAYYQWNEDYEVEFSHWVEQLFADKKGSLAACLRNPAGNSLYGEEDQGLEIFSDCADLPYLLRAYFSSRKNLPFSFHRTISGGRYTNENTPGQQGSFQDYSSLSALAQAISNHVHSGFFRFAWDLEETDTYLCQVNRDSIVAGTIYYDANGHLLVVSRVEEDGTVWFVDAHPDNSLTAKRFGAHLSRGFCKQGGGFRRWREQQVSNSASIVLTSNARSPLFDAGKSQCQDSYEVEGMALDYHQWVKRMLALGSGKIDPVREIGQQLAALDQALQERVESIQAAVAQGIQDKDHPGSLPYNIYGTEGEWEAYSTPGRDARLKAQVREIFDLMEESVAAVAAGDHPYAFSGSAAELVQEYDALWQATVAGMQVTYTNSSGGTVSLTLEEVMDRLFKLSFDPYHCPELRWGDTGTASCPDGSAKRWWYEQEQRLRNVIDKDNQAHTTLDWGPVETPDIHLGQLLERLQQEYA